MTPEQALSELSSGKVAVGSERYAVRTSAAAVVGTAPIRPSDLDQEAVRDNGLEVGEDGIPRMPVPDQPDPSHETQTQEPAR